MLIIFSFFIVKPPTVLYCLFQNIRIKSKTPVSLNTGLNIIATRHTDRSVLVHNVGKGGNRSAIACSDALVLHLDILLVVEGRIALIAVKCLFIRGCNFPDYHRHNGVFFFLNGKVRTRLATFVMLAESIIDTMNSRYFWFFFYLKALRCFNLYAISSAKL